MKFRSQVQMLLACCVLAACSTQAPRKVNDINQIKAINKEAEFRNIDVIWVHPPQTSLDTSIDVTIKANPDSDPETDADRETASQKDE